MTPCENPECGEPGTIQMVYMNENIGPYWWCADHARYVVETFPPGVGKSELRLTAADYYATVRRLSSDPDLLRSVDAAETAATKKSSSP